ncbi:uncharacterized protein HMPREF1541_09009 [Cyphellophora europaea CBS 101466]|uniref:Uncharacterized protein n=1 Tax=Cyphellophora europaea (strain CBS 101466) TaxID=1220924 RepID=W2RJS7_CYPE1|nr:uncharacterized protein HMPREF1541_09009 [Cyphellophora europaea CBS 101466]ETN36731.1 hypothetical protein HMPREF1541_09009 [Cyphellophora europaea CBS 101466]
MGIRPRRGQDYVYLLCCGNRHSRFTNGGGCGIDCVSSRYPALASSHDRWSELGCLPFDGYRLFPGHQCGYTCEYSPESAARGHGRSVLAGHNVPSFDLVV